MQEHLSMQPASQPRQRTHSKAEEEAQPHFEFEFNVN
jgi:hypothetical protein